MSTITLTFLYNMNRDLIFFEYKELTMSAPLTFTKKQVLYELIEDCFSKVESKDMQLLSDSIYQKILIHKIKFPLLEYTASLLYDRIDEQKQILFCNCIETYRNIGGNVLLGILLQKRLPSHYEESIQKATEYISNTNSWHICDIVGERVFGHALLTQTERTLSVFKHLSLHNSHWVVRSIGAGAHFAIKRGLEKKAVQSLFQLLLSMGTAKNKEIKQGVGWAAKTTAKFHPDIIESFKEEINNKEKTGQWFRSKVAIGLKRNAYAKRNRS